jgi:nitrite reductase (NO-forming)
VSTPGGRRRCTPRTVSPGSLRPSTVLVCFAAAALAFLAAGAVAAVVYATGGSWWTRWTALHLVFVGGVSQLVLGAAQFFVCAFLATDPPGRRMVAAQLACWNAGAILVAVGVPRGADAITEPGGILLTAALVLFVASLRGMQRRSLQQARWAVRWYLAAAGCLALGAAVGVLMARGTVWMHGSLLDAHLALNIGGWFGAAIVGTLHTFFPSLTQTQLRRPRLQGPTFALWIAGILALAAGAAWDDRVPAACGWLALLAAAALLGANLVASLRAAPGPLALPARLVALGQAFLPAALALGLACTLADGAAGPFTGSARAALAALLVAGWVGLTVGGSLLHLLAVLARVRGLRHALPHPRPARDALVTALAGAGIATLALSRVDGLSTLDRPGAALVLATAAVVGARIAALARPALTPLQRPRRAH